ncbi:Phosphoglucomutase [Porphyromonas macacae]|uniref:Phosphoglucomutase n=1 Tax=Porphyromonas macacae TaxID=28115 RepID=A0A379EGK4_9PORP|nr:Phosphoglucomutase [Porphyromonas macacae]
MNEKEELMTQVRAKAMEWLSPQYDEETRNAVQAMLDSADPTELIDSFYKDLEFGTGGLRGIMGAGSNRMNRYTVGAATQGLSNYLKREFADLEQIKVVIGYDCRNNSPHFADIVAHIFAANGIKVYIFDKLRPTPEISFAIRALGCQSGVMITASHNPKIYNGYKAYWSDGAQMIAPHDRNTIIEVNKIRNVQDIKFEGNDELIEVIGEEMDKQFIEAVKSLSLSPEAVKNQRGMKIVYTPIHGTGVEMVPRALRAFGLKILSMCPSRMWLAAISPLWIRPIRKIPKQWHWLWRKQKRPEQSLCWLPTPMATVWE